jgi:hypothetical protein
LAKKLNTLFKTDKFTVVILKQGEQIYPWWLCPRPVATASTRDIRDTLRQSLVFQKDLAQYS